jgi:hypothetical protein
MSSCLRALIILALVALLSGCPGDVKPTAPIVPQVVTVTVTKYVPVDPKLTAPCKKFKRTQYTVHNTVDAVNHDENYIDECNGRMDQIRDLGK